MSGKWGLSAGLEGRFASAWGDNAPGWAVERVVAGHRLGGGAFCIRTGRELVSKVLALAGSICGLVDPCEDVL